MKKLLRAATIAAATVALVAGTTTGASAAPGDATRVTVAKLKSGSTYAKTTSVIPGSFALSAPNTDISSVKASVTVNGKLVAKGVTIYQNGFYYKRAWGNGVVRLTNFTASGYDYRPGHTGPFTNRAIPAPSNYSVVRYAVQPGKVIDIKKRGKKMTFKVTATYRDKWEQVRSAKKATVQVKKGSKWRTLKTVKLNSKGKATFRKSDKKKRNYRLVIKTTDTLQGITSKGTKKI